MEKQIENIFGEIISNPFNNIGFLDKYFILFEKRKYLEKDFENIYNDMQNAYFYGRYFHMDDEELVIIFKKLLSCVIHEKNDKTRMKVIPLIIYLNSIAQDINNILYKYLYENLYFESFNHIKDFFIGTISSSDCNINLDNLPMYYHLEKELTQSYYLGIQNNDLKKIYDFLDAHERRGSFFPEPYIEFLSYVSVKIFFDDFVNIINNKNPLDIQFLIKNFTTEDKLKIAINSNNNFLKFDVIRSLVYFNSNNQFSKNLLKNENELISEIIISLSRDENNWKDFLQYFFIYPSRNPQLFLPFASTIDNLSYNKIDVLIKFIKIERFNNEIARISINNLVLKMKDDEKQKYILQRIHNRWIDFIENYHDYFGDIFLTDVIDIVIVYIREFLTKSNIELILNQSMYNLEEIDNQWFKDGSEMSNYFYKQLTITFVYSFGIEQHKLYEIRSKLKVLLAKYRWLKNEHSINNQKTTLQLFNEYIFNEYEK